MPVQMNRKTTLSLDGALVEDAMHLGVLSCPLETPLRGVARLMAENHSTCVVGVGDAATRVESRRSAASATRRPRRCCSRWRR